MKKFPINLRTWAEFIISRLFGTGVDTLVLWIFSHFILDGTYLGENIISPIISFEFAVMSNYLCSYFWIWRNRIENKTWKYFWNRFHIFNLSSVSGFLVKMLFLLLFERIFGWDVVICNLAALLISGIVNYFLADSLVFRQRPKQDN